MMQTQRIPSRDFFMGGIPFGKQRPVLGQWGELISIATGLLQAAPAAAAVYQAKRAADRAKQEKQRQDEAARAQAASDAAAQEQAKAAALEQQGLTPQGTAIQTNKILGVDPMVLAVGGIGIIGIGAALFMALKK
jgi:hypothetical protein